MAARQQMRSCDRCRQKKLKCNASQQDVCSACTKSQLPCSFKLGWRRRRRQGKLQDSVTAGPEASNDHVGLLTTEGDADHDICDDVHRGSTQTNGRDTHDTSLPRAMSNDENMPSDTRTSLSLAQNSLYRFFRDGISPTTRWTTFNQIDQVRTAYTGTTVSNLSHLVRLGSLSQSTCIIFAYPEVHAPTEWHPNTGITCEETSPSSGLSFLTRDICDDLVESFFSKIHPCFPVIDESQFRAQYFQQKRIVPPLILHAVLLGGARVSSHPRVSRSRQTVLAVLFNCAKSIFDKRHERDRMNLVQAALLFSWHLQDADSAGANSWYWLGVACRIAFGLGMHRNIIRDPQTEDRMPIADRRIWRRIWWTLFQAETMSALEHGRPSMIRLGDSDQDPLSLEDFIESDGQLNKNVDFSYCERNIELCEIASAITCLSAPGLSELKHHTSEEIANLKKRLVSWMLWSPLNKEAEGFQECFGNLNLRLHYDVIVIHLSRLTMDRSHSTEPHIETEAAKSSSGSAASIVSTLEKMHKNGLLQQGDFTIITALSAAAIQVAKDLQDALLTNSTMLAVSHRELLARLLVVAEQLSKFWPNAEGIRKVFQTIFDRMTQSLGGRGNLRPGDAAQAPFNEETHIDWTDMLAFECAAQDIDWNGSLFDVER